MNPDRPKFSIVLVCRNEAANIGRVLESVQGLTDDVLVYDNGSTDGTLDILRRYSVHLQQGEWLGFGPTKARAAQLARYDWVLSIDGDEALDNDLRQSLQSLVLDDPDTVYTLRFKNFFGDKHLKWGEWGTDWHIRLFHRSRVNWNEAAVHEQLLLPPGIRVRKLPGAVLHRTVRDTVEYSGKVVQYALLNADKYFQQGKKAGRIKRYLSPPFSFLQHYLFRLGFLDGWEGLLSARMTAYYTFLKYARLHELWKEREKGIRD